MVEWALWVKVGRKNWEGEGKDGRRKKGTETAFLQRNDPDVWAVSNLLDLAALRKVENLRTGPAPFSFNARQCGCGKEQRKSYNSKYTTMLWSSDCSVVNHYRCPVYHGVPVSCSGVFGRGLGVCCVVLDRAA